MNYFFTALTLLLMFGFFVDAGSSELSTTALATAPTQTVLDAQAHDKKMKRLHVRVLLEERGAGGLDPWNIHGKSEIFVTDLSAPKKKIKYSAARVQVTRIGAVLTDVHDQRQPMITKALRIQSADSHLCLDGTWYQGSLYIVMDGERALLINNIDIEDYIVSVVKSESITSWPIEMHKVLAIASRTYVIAKILEAQKLNRLYHIKNTNVHQTYTGYHENQEIKKAVSETSDLFLAHNDKPILAMYDICCGGVVPAKKSGVNFDAAPYLARTYPCTYCKKAKVYNWSARYSVDRLESLLRREIPHLKGIKEVRITKKDRAGAVQKVVVKANSGHHYLQGKKLYSLLKDIKSFCFSVQTNGGKIVFSGRGYGHHMGLCQWGARQMVREGWHYRRILKYYYPDTQLMKLEQVVAV